MKKFIVPGVAVALLSAVAAVLAIVRRKKADRC